LDIAIGGSGNKVQQVLVNGQELDSGLLPANREGRQEITIRMAKE
jgi:hypothetical protein